MAEGDEERWLAVCACGWMRAFLPEQPALDAKDPLRAFLLGPGRPISPPSPAWVRVFLASVERPYPARWRYRHARCEGCGASVTFELTEHPRPHVVAVCALCLNCGWVSATYSKPARGLYEAPVTGSAWAPPCPAVLRLRHCLHRPYALLGADGWLNRDWRLEGSE